MIAEAAQIDSCDPITGAYGSIKSAPKARGSHHLVQPAAESPGFSQGARAKGGSRKRQVGPETTCVCAARA